MVDQKIATTYPAAISGEGARIVAVMDMNGLEVQEVVDIGIKNILLIANEILSNVNITAQSKSFFSLILL